MASTKNSNAKKEAPVGTSDEAAKGNGGGNKGTQRPGRAGRLRTEAEKAGAVNRPEGERETLERQDTIYSEESKERWGSEQPSLAEQLKAQRENERKEREGSRKAK